MSTPRLFVYGTLAPGRPNAHVLGPLEGTWHPATIRGTLYPEGWGATLGYPAVVLDPMGPEVPGLIFTSPDLQTHWPRIDAFEGPGYRRTTTTARVQDGTAVEVEVYALCDVPER